jgi:hypothetical protein
MIHAACANGAAGAAKNAALVKYAANKTTSNAPAVSRLG